MTTQTYLRPRDGSYNAPAAVGRTNPRRVSNEGQFAPYPPRQPALAQLGMGVAAVRRFEADRPWLVAQALLTGATREQVVEVLGWELADLRFTVGRWVSKLWEQGRLNEDRARSLAASFMPEGADPSG